MAQLVLLVVAVLTGAAGYHESAKFERRFQRRVLGASPPLAGVVCLVAGVVVVFVAPAVLVGALAGLFAFNQATAYEAQYAEGPLDLPAWVWGAAGAFFGLMGTLLTSASAWVVVCTFAGLVVSLLLSAGENRRLLAENAMWMGENRRLLAEKGAKPQGAAPSGPAPVAAQPVAAQPVAAQAVAAPAVAAPAPRPQSPVSAYRQWDFATPRTPAPRPGAAPGRGTGSDLLPRR